MKTRTNTKIEMGLTPLFAALALLSLAGCDMTNQGTGTLIGAGGGAGLGAIMGNNVEGLSKAEGAIAGAVVGGVLGNVMGSQQDQINSVRSQANSANQAANSTVINVENSNGSHTPVLLTRAQNGWQGPRGEFYDNIPTESQLRRAYGF